LVTAVKASASASAFAPVVSSGVIVNATVNAVLATGASGLAVPTVSGEVVLTGGGPATASALAPIPVVTGASGGGTVLFDAVGASASSVNSVAPLSWTHTATGTARAVFVVLAVDTQATQGTFSTWTRSATYGGTAMTLIAARDSNDTAQGFVQLFGLLNPPTGAQTVVASATKSGITPARLIANSFSYTAVTSFGTGVTGIANNTVPSLAVSSAANHRAIAVFASAAAISTPTQTQRYLNNAAVGNGVSNVLVQDAAGAATVTFSAANNADWWALVGVDILP
jgi:hypothetical protein